jgi:hypothetical protein
MNGRLESARTWSFEPPSYRYLGFRQANVIVYSMLLVVRLCSFEPPAAAQVAIGGS